MPKRGKKTPKRSTPFDNSSKMSTLSDSLNQKIAQGPPSLTPLGQGSFTEESQGESQNLPLTQVPQSQTHAQIQSQSSMGTQISEGDSLSGNSSDDPLSFLFSQNEGERGTLVNRNIPEPIPNLNQKSETQVDKLPKLPSWMLTRVTADQPTVPVPKNFFELAAYRQLDVRVDNSQADRYRVLNKNPDKPTIFEPLVQPKNLSKKDKNNNFVLQDHCLADLIDPYRFRNLVTDTYPRESFAPILKLAKIFEIKRSLAQPTTRLESSLLWSTLVRITEGFLTLADLVQLLLNAEAIKKIDTLEKKQNFRETVRCALNAIAQEIYALEPLTRGRSSDRVGHNFQEEILALFNHRLEQAPVAPREQGASALCPEGTTLFANAPLTYRDVKNLSNTTTNPRKRKRTSEGRGFHKDKKRKKYGAFKKKGRRSGKGPRAYRNSGAGKENIPKFKPISSLNSRETPKKAAKESKV